MQADEIFVLVLVVLFAGAIAAAAIDSRRRSSRVQVNSLDAAPDDRAEASLEVSELSTRDGGAVNPRRGTRPRQGRRR
jgi:Tfp pilus assembly protein PilX